MVNNKFVPYEINGESNYVTFFLYMTLLFMLKPNFSTIFIMSVPPVMHININAMFNQGQKNEHFVLLEWCKKEKNEFIVL